MTGKQLETLSPRRLNRAMLARQHLLERTDRTLAQVVEDMGGIQTQYAPSGYLALWSRMRDFERDSLTRAKEARDVVTGTLMRVTIHTVSARDYWPIVAAIRRSRQEWLMRVIASGWPEANVDAAASALRTVMSHGPIRARDLTNEMTALGFARQTVGWAGLWVDIVRIPPSGTWERRANDLYDLAERWLPSDSQPGNVPAEHDAVRLLFERYLAAFGPAAPADFANWAGVPIKLVRAATDDVPLSRFRDVRGRALVDLPGAPLPPEDTPAPVRFLPVWDATLLVHCRRTLVLAEEHRPKIFNTRTPHSLNTFLIDGYVAGTWRYESGDVRTEAFRPLTAEEQRDVDAEADRLARFHSG
jgi:winged helix DNA-binding protein